MFERIGRNAARTLLAGAGAAGLSACAVDPGSATVARISPIDTASPLTPDFPRRPTPARPRGSLHARGGAHEARPVIDLTEEGAVVWDRAKPEIIDTRLFTKQINASTDWKGPVRDIEEELPGEPEVPRVKPGAAPESLPVGGISADPVAIPGMLFPGIGQTPWTPPDPTIAVGRDHIVETVNMAIAFYAKDGTLEFSQDLNDAGGFFGSVGGGDYTFDPKCFYDHLTGRFVVLALEVYGSTESWITLAISDDGDPHGIWYKYRTDAVITVGPATFWWDYPGFGYDTQAYYVTGNLFGLNGTNWGGVGIRVFDKAKLLDPVNPQMVYSTMRDPNAVSCQVAQHFGTAQTPFLVSVANTAQLRINSIMNPLTAPVLATTFVTVPLFNSPGSGPNIGGLIVTVDERVLNVVWRDGNMFAGHIVTAGGKTVARWYEMRTNSWPAGGPVTLYQTGNIDVGPGVHSYFPAIYTNRCGDAGVVFGSSSAGTTPNIKVTGRRFDDPLGQLAAPTTIITGPAGATGRWGDYFGMAVDPVDDTRFWFVGEYQTASGWATHVGSFLVSCPSDFNCDGFVDPLDFNGFINAFEGGDINADFNVDGFVDPLDLNGFMNAFEPGVLKRDAQGVGTE